jgi:DNA polymerase IV
MVQPSRETKSVSAERTFEHNIKELADVNQEIDRIARISFERYQRTKTLGFTIVLKLKYADFRQVTRSKTLDHPVTAEDEYAKTALSLMNEDLLDEEGIRLIGVGISNFKKEEIKEEPTQLTLEF